MRVLENHLHAQRVRQLIGAAQTHGIAALIQQFAFGLAVQAGHDAAQGGLAATRFAHQPDDFAALDGQVHAVHGIHRAAVQRAAGQGQDALGQVGALFESLVDVLELDDGSIGLAHACCASRAIGT
ncbi:hypothetical protein D3C77_660470 [compost metagenome]